MKPRPRRKHLLDLTLHGLPELDQFESEEQRAAALQELGDEAGNPKSGGFWLAIVILVGSVLAFRLLALFLMRLVSWPSLVEEAIQWTIMVLAFAFVLRRLHRSGSAMELRKKLLSRGIPVCLGCWYSLRGSPAGATRCPECGCEFDPSVCGVVDHDRPKNASMTESPLQ